MSIYYETDKLREYAALSNVPIIYCLEYENQTHRISGLWAHEWLVNYITSTDPAVFHPYALRLIKENLAAWKNPFADATDYELFLRGAMIPGQAQVLDTLIQQAINENKVLYVDKSQSPWNWKLSIS